MFKFIEKNPYRILGVYANSPKKDIVANKGKAAAFLKVNKSVEYLLDLNEMLKPLSRTLDMMNEADAHLTIAQEQVRYAQFWFVKKTPFDEIAFNHLIAGDMSMANEIWSKQDTLSSLQNRMVCSLVDEDVPLIEAVQLAEKLYGEFGDEYIVQMGLPNTLQMNKDALLHMFVDTLGKEVDLTDLLEEELDDDWRNYINQHVVTLLVNKILAEVNRAQSVSNSEPEARLKAGKTLISNTKREIVKLREISDQEDLQYQMVVDKLGLEILQCGIDYFNKSEDDDKHKAAMKMQKYAQSVVVGDMAKQRCDENVKILQKIIDELPPEEVIPEYRNLQKAVFSFVHSYESVDDVEKLICSTVSDIVSIKEKLGKYNPFYRQQTTLIANIALSKVIDVINDIQKEIDESDTKDIRHIFSVSWRIMLLIQLMDTEKDFVENRFNPNKKTFSELLNQVDAFDPLAEFMASELLCRQRLGLSVGSFSSRRRSAYAGCCAFVIDKYVYYTDDEFFNEIKSSNVDTLSKYRDYLKRYPNGKHLDEVQKQISIFEEELEKQRKRREMECQRIKILIVQCNSLEDCIALIGQCQD